MKYLIFTGLLGVILVAGVALSPLLTGQLQIAQAQSNMTGNMTSGNATMSGNMTGNMTSGNMTATSGNQSSASGTPVKVVLGAATLGDKAFDPDSVTISKGTTVTWTNDDSALHTITSGSPSSEEEMGKLFDSGYDFSSGKTFSYTFNSTGNFDYFCQLHPTMIGKVIVN